MPQAKKNKSVSSKSGAKTGSNKPRPAPSGKRNTAASDRRPVSSKGKSTSAQKQAFMRGARSRGGLGTWGLFGLLGVLVVFAILYFSGVLTPDTQEDAQTTSPADISLAEAYALYPDGAYFLDVRELDEWQTGRVPETNHIPLSELESRLSELPRDQDIVVICRSGNRSQVGRDTLLDAGFENVTSMTGGVSDWKDAGYPFDGEILR